MQRSISPFSVWVVNFGFFTPIAEPIVSNFSTILFSVPGFGTFFPTK